MSLKTGAKITRRSWDEIPVPEGVIKRVNALGKDQPQLFVFTDHHGRATGEHEIPGVDGEETQEAQPNQRQSRQTTACQPHVGLAIF